MTLFCQFALRENGEEKHWYKKILELMPKDDTDDSTTDNDLIFEKNIRDERPVYCPACRTSNIQGNSYPILNVRSWECENPLCPERSKYNRGKRYAFSSSMRQELIFVTTRS